LPVKKVQPGAGAEVLAVSPDHIHGIFFGLQGNRVHEQFPANLIPQKVLHLNEVWHHYRTNIVAFGIEEVDGDDFVFHQIVVESHFLAFVSQQRQVWQVQLPNAFAGLLLHRVRGGYGAFAIVGPGDRRGNRRQRRPPDQVSS
jgi:hypothetical protein